MNRPSGTAARVSRTFCAFLNVTMPVKRCEPAHVKEISELVAQVKGCGLAELSAATCRTAQEFFPKLR